MTKFLTPFALSFAILLASSCSSTKVDRGFASYDEAPGLSGTLLGYVKYKKMMTRRKRLSGKNFKFEKTETDAHRAARVYFRKTNEGDGSYNVLLLEYVNLLKMAPKYVLSNKAPDWVNKRVGYLNQITSRALMYKAFPTAEPKVYELQKMRVVNGKLSSDNSEKPSLLKLAKDPSEKNPLEGATITASENGEEVEVYFPSENESGDHGMQYMLAKFVYNLIDGFKSTWRTSFLSGDYLGAYGDKKDVVLKLSQEKSGDEARFVINEDRSYLSEYNRKKQFTNPKSAHISGDYLVDEPEDGVFVFSALAAGEHKGKEHVDQRIGLFVDIFDASETKLNQDVVELIILNENDPSDFLMYYEHPDNGEGR